MKLLVLALAACVIGANAFSFKRCGGNNDLDVISANVEPGIIVLPGHIKVSFAGRVTKQFNNMDLKLEVFLKAVIGEVKIPCLFQFGSCTYTDMCTLLDRMERENWAGVGAKLAQTIKALISSIDGAGDKLCPFTPTEVIVNNRPLDLPPLPPLLATIAAGKYRVKVELSNHDTKALMSCFEVEFEMRKGD